MELKVDTLIFQDITDLITDKVHKTATLLNYLKLCQDVNYCTNHANVPLSLSNCVLHKTNLKIPKAFFQGRDIAICGILIILYIRGNISSKILWSIVFQLFDFIKLLTWDFFHFSHGEINSFENFTKKIFNVDFRGTYQHLWAYYQISQSHLRFYISIFFNFQIMQTYDWNHFNGRVPWSVP